MRKLVAAALIGVMTMGLTVCGVSAADFDSSEISPLFPVRMVPVPEVLSSSFSVFRKSRTARKSI